MHVIVLSEYYEPDLGPDAPLFTMLCENLVRLGHQVTMITAVPHYPSGRVSAQYHGKRKWIWKSVENGVEVIRVALPSLDRSKFPQRMLQFFCYQIGATWASLGKKYDTVISTGPSLEVWLPYTYLVALRHKPAIYFVLDVYPGVGVTLGIFRNKLVVAMVSKFERFCLNNASAILVLSDSFRLELRTLGVPDEKMNLISIWVDTDLVHPMPRDNSFSRENDLNNKFVVLYAGNLGLSQELGQVLVAAEMLKEHKDVNIVFVGDGANRAQLVADAEHRQLENVKFIPYQPRQRLPEVLASADVSLVKLQKGVSLSSVPSKTFSLLASGRPILANVDEKSECWELISQAKAGLCVPPGDPSALVETILTLRRDQELCERMGHNGRIWAENYHSPQAAARKIEKLLLEITCSNNKMAGR
jgi:colanic acid biosynthesis glycosyl transferase WcaI